jgi:hypothetical protein
MDPLVKRLRYEVEIPDADLAKARETYRDALRKLSLSTSVITNIAVGLCHVVFTKSPQFDTMAVTLAGDGQPILIQNVDFLIKIGHEQAVFGLTHEIYHLLMLHLHTDPAFRKNPNWVTATEACINYRVANHLNMPGLIKVDGKVAIVDPAAVYKSYREALKNAGMTPVSFEDFMRTDLGCFSELERMPKPPKLPKNAGSCVHAANGGAGNPDGDSPAPLDQSEVGKFMDKVLSSAVTEAKNGRADAKNEILAWMDAAPEASTTWGNLGAGTLRGETTKTRKTDLWERWTADAIASRLEEGNRLRYAKKVWWDPRVSASGKQEVKHGGVFVDTSGSMPQTIIDKIAALIGETENLHVEWHCFDGDIWPFVPGESGMQGGGGTSFQIIDEHCADAAAKGHQCCDVDRLDFILVITDGYAPHLDPATMLTDPDGWIWLITDGGDPWPEKVGMSCRQIDLP